MKKVWVFSLFGRYKGLLLEKTGDTCVVELVGYPFGSHPNGKEIIAPVSRLTPRDK